MKHIQIYHSQEILTCLRLSVGQHPVSSWREAISTLRESGGLSEDQAALDLGRKVFSVLKHPPSYQQLLHEELHGQCGAAILIILDFLNANSECNVLLFCPADGGKLLFARHEDDIYFVFLRSGIRDESYTRLISLYYGLSADALDAAFVDLPQFCPDVIESIIEQLGDYECEPQFARSLRDLCSWYHKVDRLSPYAFDVRVFSLMRAYRDMLCDIKMHLLVAPQAVDSQTAPAPVRLYVYHTDELIPGRPPIYACPASSAMLVRAQKAQMDCRDSETGYLLHQVEPGHPVKCSRISDVLGYKHLNPEGWCYTFDLSVGLPGFTVLLEVYAPTVASQDVWLAHSGLKAALDSTYVTATQSLISLLPMADATTSRRFDQLADLFATGLTCPEIITQSKVPQENTWQKGMKKIRDLTHGLYPAALGSSDAELLMSALSYLQDEWKSGAACLSRLDGYLKALVSSLFPETCDDELVESAQKEMGANR